VYDEIADYYDTLYATKDYESECRFLRAVFRKYRRPVRRILDLGCGTGSHAGILGRDSATPVADRVIVTGVDRSERMLEKARMKFPHLDFRRGDITTYRSSDSYDAALALFDVLGHVPVQDLERVFHTANYHLTADGLFIFDAWNRAALMRGQRPHGRLDQYKAPQCASPHLFKYVEMYYVQDDDAGHVEYVVIDLACQKVIRHEYKATLLTEERVRELCQTTGFNLLSYTRHCTLAQRPLSRDWRVSVVLQKATS
jgi:SAM-dependent methyltransferase